MIKAKYNAEPYVPNRNGPKVLCPKCGSDSLRIEKTVVFLTEMKNLRIEPKKTNCDQITDGTIEVTFDNGNDDCSNYAIQNWHKCKNGHRGIIEFQRNTGITFLVHRPIPNKRNDHGKRSCGLLDTNELSPGL